MNGRFIVLEGGEGGGKGTQARKLTSFLQERYRVNIVHTREPGGTPNAEKIRSELLKGASDKWDGLSELLLVMAARRDHMRRVIQPALARGDWVLSERFVLSTYVYQGVLRGVESQRIDRLYQWISGGLKPDITIILDVDPRIGVPRTKQESLFDGISADRFEMMDWAFHDHVRAAYLNLARDHGYPVIDASQSVSDVFEKITASITSSL